MSDSPGIAVAEPPVETAVPLSKPGRRSKPKRQPPYHVILWNDDHHSVDYVVAMLKELFGYPAEKGTQIAETVHTKGKAIVLTTTMERAELKRDQIHAYGKDKLVANCQGSMSATLEAAE